MERRQFIIKSVPIVSTGILSGCLGGGEDDEPDQQTEEPQDEDSQKQGNGGATRQVTEVSVSGDNYTPQAAMQRMTIEYNTATTTEINPPDSLAREPDSGNKFVVLRGDVTVDSEFEGQINVYGSVVTLQAGGLVVDGRPIRGLPELTQTVVPGATFEAWKYFEVSEDVTEASLTTSDPDAWFDRRTEIIFEQNSNLSADLS